MPNGAVLSLQGRNVFANLRDLEEAISRVPQLEPDVPRAAPKGAGLASVTKRGFRTGSGLIQGTAPRRSNVELSVNYSKPAEGTSTRLEANLHGTQPKRQTVRNKSGEVVKPALRQGQCRPRPTGSKSVSFDSREHARHFFKVDPPLDISSNRSSPTDSCDYAAEDVQPTCSSPSYMFEVTVADSNREPTALETFPVYLERVWISSDHRCLVGSTVVANKAFQKSVSCRYTLDHWKTWSEVTAEFSCKIRPEDTKIDRDRFTFTVKLLDSVDVATTLFFCIRYNVDGQEYWDNNSGANFRVNIRKTYQQQIGKSFQGVSKTSDLSTHRPLAPGPKSTTPISDNFRKDSRADLRLKDSRAKDVRSNDHPSLLPNNLALATRYSLDASLISASHAKDRVVKRPPEVLNRSLPGSALSRRQ